MNNNNTERTIPLHNWFNVNGTLILHLNAEQCILAYSNIREVYFAVQKVVFNCEFSTVVMDSVVGFYLTLQKKLPASFSFVALTRVYCSAICCTHGRSLHSLSLYPSTIFQVSFPPPIIVDPVLLLEYLLEIF